MSRWQDSLRFLWEEETPSPEEVPRVRRAESAGVPQPVRRATRFALIGTLAVCLMSQVVGVRMVANADPQSRYRQECEKDCRQTFNQCAKTAKENFNACLKASKATRESCVDACSSKTGQARYDCVVTCNQQEGLRGDQCEATYSSAYSTCTKNEQNCNEGCDTNEGDNINNNDNNDNDNNTTTTTENDND